MTDLLLSLRPGRNPTLEHFLAAIPGSAMRAGSQRWRLERRWRRPIRMPARARRRRLGLRVVHVEISEDAAEAEKRPVD